MKKYILIFTSFLFFNSYSQSRDTVHFFINKKDTLIQKQLATKTNEYEGYRIIDENRLVIKHKKSFKEKPTNIVLKKGEIWVSEGDDIEYETFASYSFSFNRKNDTIISRPYLNTLKLIEDRRKFIDSIKEFDDAWINFVFIEPIGYNKFILRKVEILTFE